MSTDPALVLVDLQRNFCDPVHNDALAEDPAAAEAMADALDATRSFLERYRAAGGTPVFVRTHQDPAWRSAALERHRESDGAPDPCLPGSPGAAFVDGLGVDDESVVVTKRRYDPFFGTDLDVYLSSNDVSRVLLAGVNTHVCVTAAAFGAVDRDYEVTVLADCTAASSVARHDAALDTLDVVATEVCESDRIPLD